MTTRALTAPTLRVDRLTKSDLTLVGVLLFVSIVPALGGAARLASLAGDAAPTEESARFLAAPIPIALHVVGATLYALLGAFQFSPGFRRIWPGFHRAAGRVLVVAGVTCGVTGLWMTATFDIPNYWQGPLVYYVRWAVGVGMLASLAVAVHAVMRRDFVRHEAFMIRAYALGQGAATQAVIMLPWMLITGHSAGVTRDLLLTLSWLINVALAEVILYDRRRTRAAALTR